MSSGALRAAWEAAQKPDSPLRKAWEDAQRGPSIHDEYKTGNLARRMATENATDAAEASDATGTTWRELASHPRDIPDAFGRSAMATEANLSHGLPGMKAVQAFLRSKLRGQSYREALADIEGETGRIPETLRNVEKGVGAAPAALAMPMSTVPKAIASAVALSGAGELANPNPDVGPEERASNAMKAEAVAGGTTAVLGGAGAVLPKVAKTVNLARRVRSAPTLGETATQFEKNIADATKANYGTAAAEGEANGGTSPALAKVLERPRIAKYVEMVRDGEEGSPTSDADVARDVYKLMSKARRGHTTFMERNGYDAARDLEAQKLGREMKRLKEATASASQRPPITLDIAGETHSVDPKITPGREAMSGPVGSGPLAARTTAPSDPTLRQALRDFPESSLPSKMQGPSGPAFQLRGQPDKVIPGVEVETPSMRIQTAPAEDVAPVMPSFPHAVAEKARMEGERGLFNEGSDVAKRVMRGTSLAGKDLRTKSPEAWREMIADKVAEGKLSKADAEAALKGFLGRAKEEMRLKLQPGIVRNVAEVVRGPASRLNKAAPLIDQLERAAGRSTDGQFDPEAFQKLLISYLSTQPQLGTR